MAGESKSRTEHMRERVVVREDTLSGLRLPQKQDRYPGVDPVNGPLS